MSLLEVWENLKVNWIMAGYLLNLSKPESRLVVILAVADPEVKLSESIMAKIII